MGARHQHLAAALAPSPTDQRKPGSSGPARQSSPAEKRFFIGGHNGVALVEGPLVERGWKRNADKDEPFFLKWVEIRRDIDFSKFKSGTHMINRNPNVSALCTKIKLLESLENYERRLVRQGKALAMPMATFFPESYKLDDARGRAAFAEAAEHDPAATWICKPTGMNQGKGIYLVPDAKKFLKELKAETTSAKRQARLIQRYLPTPLLLRARKFDIRAYMLIACNEPSLILYHPGYCRLSCEEYSMEDTENLAAHLTNQYVQKKHPDYKAKKDDTVWSFEQLNEYLNSESGDSAPKDWAAGPLQEQMKTIMKHCYMSVRDTLDPRQGFFDLLGFDFMVDSAMNVWLIEINVNPALHTGCTELKALLPGMVRSTLDIVLEVQEKRSCRKPQPVLPLDSMGAFQLIYCSEKP